MQPFDYEQVQRDFQQGVFDGIRKAFPVEGKTRRIRLEALEAPDVPNLADDLKRQYQIRAEGGDFTAPVYGSVVLESLDGKVLDKQRIRVANLPVITRRHSFILDGKEWQVSNQWQLMPGVYTRRAADGQLEARFNTPTTKEFKVVLDPESKEFQLQRGGTKNIPLYPLMKSLGVGDVELERAWGKELYTANKNSKFAATAFDRFRKADKFAGASAQSAEDYFKRKMQEAVLRPESTEKTLGKPLTHAGGEAFLLATKRLLAVQDGAPEDDSDSLEFKSLRTVGDFAKDRLTQTTNFYAIRNAMLRKLHGATSVRDVVRAEVFNRPLRQAFTDNSAARLADQINPLEMLSSASLTTITGPGGIQSQQALDKMVKAKLLNPSHFGFLDAVQTPEGSGAGVSLHLPLGIEKDGTLPKISVWDIKANKFAKLAPAEFQKATVALPDQLEWKGGKPVLPKGNIQVSLPGNQFGEAPITKVQYALRSPAQLFGITTNLLPFLNSTSGNRATYATGHYEQALSLKEREAPLVQVATTPGAQSSWEEVIGKATSHTAPVAGKVTAVTKDGIRIRQKDGRVHTVSLYDNFPTNHIKGLLHSTPTVSVGDQVQVGQHVADTNYTSGGKLALGKALNTAYLARSGLNFEDGIVISETAAKKMTSEHMYKPSHSPIDGAISAPTKFATLLPTSYTREQLAKVDEQGVVRVGQKVLPGDPLALAATPYEMGEFTAQAGVRKALRGIHSDRSLKWSGSTPGEVTDVIRTKDGTLTVHVKTLEPLGVADKLSTRHGAKGVVSRVVPDALMPRGQDGKPFEILLNPLGVGGRMNPSQIFETVAGKIAEKTGKPYLVENFSKTPNVLKVKEDLKRHGLSDTEELFDPTTGLSLGKVLTGRQYMLKLVHQADKYSARGGMPLPGDDPEKYEKSSLLPAGGKGTGGKSMGPYGLFSLLNHGAVANIREMQTFKSEGDDPQSDPRKRWNSQHAEVWAAIQTGQLIPTPKPTFAFQKFTDMLRASGINVDKKGHGIQLMPMTNQQVLAMSNGVIPKPNFLTKSTVDKETGELEPVKGGLFDEKITGGLGGRHWSHVNLPEPIPNPVFAAPIQKLTGLKEKEYLDIINGKRSVLNGKLVALDTPGSKAGGLGIQSLLEAINPKTALKQAEAELAGMRVPKLLYTTTGVPRSMPKVDHAVKRIKYLRALNQAGMSPAEAYMLHNVPVLPPAMRTPTLLPSGAVRWEDVNALYHQLGQMTTELPHLVGKLPDQDLKSFRSNIYDCVAAIQGLGAPQKEGQPQGLIAQIAGSSPKYGFFQKKLLNRKQDLTMYGVVVPGPDLGLDEVGLPKKHALRMYRPFVTNKLVQLGMANNALEARKVVQEGGDLAFRALEQVIKERPVIMKRDPALHRHSVQALTPRLVSGNSIHVHPLVTSGYNMDFDGDAVSVYVPVTPEAVQEAYKMLPSNNLYGVSTGKPLYTPTMEAALGLFKLSRVGQDSQQKFSSAADAVAAVQQGKLGIDAIARIGGVRTTPGRVLLANALPEPMKKQMLTDHSFQLSSKGIDTLFGELAKKHNSDYAQVADRLKDLGNGASSGAVPIFDPALKGVKAITGAENPKLRQWVPMQAHTLTLDDFMPDTQSRDKHLNRAQQAVSAINRSSLSPLDKQRQIVSAYSKATDMMTKEHLEKMEKSPNNLALMRQAGVKPSTSQYRQMALAPVMLADALGSPILRPVTRSYGEGLDVAGYWTQQHGARGGSIKKTQQVRDPGEFSKLLMNTTMDVTVTARDCGTQRGVLLSAADPSVQDRVLASPFKMGKVSLPAGKLLTPDLVGQIRTQDPKAHLMVRSVLRCEHGTGVCQRCAGLSHEGKPYDVGANIGVQAAQSLGERAVQLTLKEFHSGGTVGGGSGVLNLFERAKQLTTLPARLPDAATLASRSGIVEKVEADKLGTNIWVGGVRHHVGKDRQGQPLWQDVLGKQRPADYKEWTPPRVGLRVEAGKPLSDPNRTVINPHDLYRTTGNMERVQSYLTDELYGLYKDQGVRRQHVETLVGAMGRLTKVRDPGDSGLIKGDFANAAKLRALNKTLVKQKLRPIEHSPVLKGVNTMPLQLQEDWMAKLMHRNLSSSLLESAAVGSTTQLHGTHPIPALAFGAEVGLNVTHSKRPGLGHLKNVPVGRY